MGTVDEGCMRMGLSDVMKLVYSDSGQGGGASLLCFG
jgi:hypothetical protein